MILRPAKVQITGIEVRIIIKHYDRGDIILALIVLCQTMSVISEISNRIYLTEPDQLDAEAVERASGCSPSKLW